MRPGEEKERAMKAFIAGIVKPALRDQKCQLERKLGMLREELEWRVMNSVECSIASKRMALSLQEKLEDDIEGRENMIASIVKRVCVAEHAIYLFGNYDALGDRQSYGAPHAPMGVDKRWTSGQANR